MTTVVGIDPGLTGAVAVLRGGDAQVWDMPTTPYWKRKRVDPVALRKLLPGDATLAVVEQVNADPKFGAASSFTFGLGLGTVLSVLDLLGLPTVLVRPQPWKKAVLGSPTASKADAVAFVLDRFPGLAPPGGKKKLRHDHAEAVCLALYGLENNR